MWVWVRCANECSWGCRKVMLLWGNGLKARRAALELGRPHAKASSFTPQHCLQLN